MYILFCFSFLRYLEPYERFEAGEEIYFPSSSSVSLLSPPPRKLLFQSTPLTTTTTKGTNTITAATNLISSKLPHLTAIPAFNNLLKQFEKTPELLGQISSMPSLLQLPPNQLQLVQLLIQQLNSLKSEQGKGPLSIVGARVKCDWVIRSLQCGLPNEVDLAMNSLLIMSVKSMALVLPDIPPLFTVLLAHVGIFSAGNYIMCDYLYCSYCHKKCIT